MRVWGGRRLCQRGTGALCLASLTLKIGPQHPQKESLKTGTTRYQGSLGLKIGASLCRPEMENSTETQFQLHSCHEGTPCPPNQATLEGAPTNRYSKSCLKSLTQLFMIHPGEVKPHGAEVWCQPPQVPIS